MPERERLIQLIKQKQNGGTKYGDHIMHEKKCSNAELANYLLENGISIIPCKVGDTLYYYQPESGESYEGEPIWIWNIIESVVREIRINKKRYDTGNE